MSGLDKNEPRQDRGTELGARGQMSGLEIRQSTVASMLSETESTFALLPAVRGAERGDGIGPDRGLQPNKD